MVPFAGIAFLWFIGVIRDRIGNARGPVLRDGVPGERPALHRHAIRCLCGRGGPDPGFEPCRPRRSSPRRGSRTSGSRPSCLYAYAMRMAAVFTISVATISLRTHILPRWIAFAGYACALVLLISAVAPHPVGSAAVPRLDCATQHPHPVAAVGGRQASRARGRILDSTDQPWSANPSGYADPNREKERSRWRTTIRSCCTSLLTTTPTLPSGSSGVIAIFDVRLKPKVEEALSKASKVDEEEVDAKSLEQAKEAAAKA